MADFDPQQLDVLEDALEGLEDIDDLEALDLAPELCERLAEYQDVLALCREAFPSEEPSDALLADVIAEAHAVAHRSPVVEADGSGWRRFWQRWRNALIPGIALAGTAAAVLWILDPDRTIEQGAELIANDERPSAEDRESGDLETNKLDADKADSKRSEPASEPGVEDDGDDADELEGPEVIEGDDVGEIATPEQPVNLGGSKSGGGPSAKKSKRKAATPEPAVAPEPKPEPMTKDETWTALDRANADRRKGDCDRARSIYEDVIAASSDSLAVARAKAGIGLCLEQDRRSAEANDWFDDARSAHASVKSWIEEERDKQPLPGETKKKSPAKSKKSAAESL